MPRRIRFEGDRRGVTPLVGADDVGSRSLCPDRQLLGGGRAEGVRGPEDDLLAAPRFLRRQLAYGGGLPGSVDPHHHPNLGPGNAVRGGFHGLDRRDDSLDLVADRLFEPVGIAQLLSAEIGAGDLEQLRSGLHADVRREEHLLELPQQLAGHGLLAAEKPVQPAHEPAARFGQPFLKGLASLRRLAPPAGLGLLRHSLGFFCCLPGSLLEDPLGLVLGLSPVFLAPSSSRSCGLGRPRASSSPALLALAALLRAFHDRGGSDFRTAGTRQLPRQGLGRKGRGACGGRPRRRGRPRADARRSASRRRRRR